MHMSSQEDIDKEAKEKKEEESALRIQKEQKKVSNSPFEDNEVF